MERRLAFGALLVFAAALPIQVAMPGLGSLRAAVFPGDLALGASLLAFALAVVRGTVRPRLGPFGLAVVAYLLLLLPSVAASESPSRSAVKWCAVLVYAAAALLAMNLADSEIALRKVAAAWLIGTALTVVVGLVAVALFYLDSAPGLVARLTSDFGSLPSGRYARVGALFHQRQPNLVCHYLSISVLIVCASASVGWLGRGVTMPLLAGILVVAAFTLSLGIGGIALGMAWWLAWSPALRTSQRLRHVILTLGVLVAIAFAILIVVSPGAPLFSFRAAPSARVGCWKAAWAQLTAHPITGRGLGLEPACPDHVVASGATAQATDSHSLYLSLASTQGLLGVAGFAGMVVVLLRRSFPLPRITTSAAIMTGSLTIAFVQSWLYQGLAASYEYTRHGWLLMGLLCAAQDQHERRGGRGSRGAAAGDVRRVLTSPAPAIVRG